MRMPSRMNCTASAASSTPTTARPVQPGHPEQPVHLGRDQQQQEREQQHPEQDQDHHRERSRSPWASATRSMVAPIAPGPAMSGVARGTPRCRPWPPPRRFPRSWSWCRPRAAEHHVDRDQQEENAAGDTQRRQRDAEQPQHRLAEQREHEQDGGGDQCALERHLASLGRRVVGRERSEQRGHVRRPDGGEVGGERDQRGLERLAGCGAPLASGRHGDGAHRSRPPSGPRQGLACRTPDSRLVSRVLRRSEDRREQSRRGLTRTVRGPGPSRAAQGRMEQGVLALLADAGIKVTFLDGSYRRPRLDASRPRP